MSIVAGRAVCGRCRALVDLADERCDACDATVAHRVWNPVVSPLQGLVPASALRLAVSAAISTAVIVLAAAVIGVAASSAGLLPAVVLAVASGAVATCSVLAMWSRRGRGPGDLLLGIRWVREDGTPPATVPPRARVIAVRIGAHSDPARLTVPPLDELPARAAAADPVDAPPRPVVIVFDDGTRVALRRAAVLGRRPGVSRGEQAVALGDLSRRISKEHVRIEREGGAVYATDLGSTNGTELETGGRIVTLDPHVRVAVPADATLLVAGRTVKIETWDAAVHR